MEQANDTDHAWSQTPQKATMLHQVWSKIVLVLYTLHSQQATIQTSAFTDSLFYRWIFLTVAKSKCYGK